jgi:hypothetical protein
MRKEVTEFQHQNLVIINTIANPDKNMIPTKLKIFNSTEG